MFINKFDSCNNVECGLVRTVKIGGKEETVPIPLKSVEIQAAVVHCVAQVEITQVYKNVEKDPIEAVYFFPTDSNGGVTFFQAKVNGKTIQASVKPIEDAEKMYQEAVGSGRTAFLANEAKPDIFKLKIGYLKAGCEAVVSIGYVTEVKNEEESKSMRFYIPTTVAPRYVSPHGKKADIAEQLKNMVFTLDSPAKLSIKVFINLQSKLKNVESPTHKIGWEKSTRIEDKPNWNKTLVKLDGSVTDMDRDFVLIITPEQDLKPSIFYEELQDGSFAAMVHYIPSFTLKEKQPSEFIFLLDRSGSMQGSSIMLAKQALMLFLHSLPVNCYFNVFGFGSRFRPLFPSSHKYDDDSLNKAIQHAEDIRADMGGTEIFKPLEAILNLDPVPGYFRQVFVLTDGEVSDTENVIALAYKHRQSARIFSLGIGGSASHDLVQGVAKAGGGSSYFCSYEENIDKKVLLQLKQSMKPSVADLKVEWIRTGVGSNSSKVSSTESERDLLESKKAVESETTSSSSENSSFYQVPHKIPPVLDGNQLLVFGVFENMKPNRVEITANSPDGPLSLQLPISIENDVGKIGIIHKLAAIQIIRSLELRLASKNIENKTDVCNDHSEEYLKKQIILLSCKHGVISKFTSFFGVINESDENPFKAMQTRYIPSQLAYGWGGAVGIVPVQASLHFGGKNRAVGASPTSVHVFRRPKMAHPVAENCAVHQGPAVSTNRHIIQHEMYSEPTEPVDPLQYVASLQTSGGFFELNEKISFCIQIDLKKLSLRAESNRWDARAWATALAIVYMKKKLAKDKATWELICLKSEEWLKKEHSAHFAVLIRAAEQMIQ